MTAQPVELYSDCDHCRVEASSVETYDVSAHVCRFGVPRDVRCRLCSRMRSGHLTPGQEPLSAALEQIPSNACPCCARPLPPEALDSASCKSCGCNASMVVVHEGHAFTKREELESALAAWALEDSFASVEDLLDATFVDPSLDHLLASLQRRDRIETVADPFALGSRGLRDVPPNSQRKSVRPPAPTVSTLIGVLSSTSTSTSPEATTTTTTTATVTSTTTLTHGPKSSIPRSIPPPSAPPRAIVYPLVSVIAADGDFAPKEREIVDRFLVSEGLPPLADEEFRVHDPAKVARYIPENRREAVLRLMCETAAIDGMPDDSEIRVIRAFATAWNIPDEKVDLWLWGYENIHASSARLFWLRIRRFLLSSRWEDP